MPRNPDDYRPPAWQWYPRDWFASGAFAAFDLEQQAAYRNLLDRAWLDGDPPCFLPDDPERLARLAGWIERPLNGRWTDVLEKFQTQRGKLVNIRQLEQWCEARDRWLQQCDAGSASAKARRAKALRTATSVERALNGRTNGRTNGKSTSAPTEKQRPGNSASAPASALKNTIPPATPTEDEVLSEITDGIGEAHQAAFGSALPSRWKTAIRKKFKSGDREWLEKIDAGAMREAKARCKPPMGWGLGTVLAYVEQSGGNDKPDGREIVDRETLTCEQCNLTIEVLKHADGKPSRTGPEPCEHLMEKGRDWFNARK